MNKIIIISNIEKYLYKHKKNYLEIWFVLFTLLFTGVEKEIIYYSHLNIITTWLDIIQH